MRASVDDLVHLRRHVFSGAAAGARARRDVRLFSAPGEGREAVEIVRRMLDEAERGVPFDEMAVFLRTPQHYLGLLEHACARGGVPAYFDRGIRRPDPAGRAFIALLSCAVEGLSARRFDEYLSLGQVPQCQSTVSSPQSPVESPESSVRATRCSCSTDDGVTPESPEDVASAEDAGPDSDDEAIIAGTLRAPWKWEELVVESAVVGGRTRADGGARWRRRLDGLAADYRLRIDELKRDEPESARIKRFERDLKNLRHLREFALPIVDDMAAWPDRATWGEWLDRASRWPARALRRPDSRARDAGVAAADGRGRSGVDRGSPRRAARSPRHARLGAAVRRYGRVFIGTPHQARGRTFRVVFVPGLAERVVPQRPHEDPLLLDDRRGALGGLADQDDRKNAERLLLKLSIGAATERVYLSYPRLDVAETRVRVPSFYALDVVRAITGEIPDHRQLARDAAEEAGASLAWPAPKDPAVRSTISSTISRR